MSNLFRYAATGTAVLLFILGPLGWAYQFRQSFRTQLAQSMRDQMVADGNAAAAKLSDAEILADGVGIELPPDVMKRIWLSDMLLGYWWVWVLFIVGVFCVLNLLPTRQAADGRPAQVPSQDAKSLPPPTIGNGK